MRASKELSFVLASRYDLRLLVAAGGELDEIRTADLRFILAEPGSCLPQRGTRPGLRRVP